MPRPQTKCITPPHRLWGWAAQLYSLRSETDAGVGDLGALRTLAAWSADRGAEFVLLSPLHSLAPGSDSPYYPTTRCFRDVNCLPGLGPPGRRDGLVDRTAARRIKLRDLADAAPAAPASASRREFIEEQGELLRGFVAFQVLAGKLGWDYQKWPAEFRDEPTRVTAKVWSTSTDEAEFLCFVQWAIDEALRELCELGCPPVNDIAVGVDPGGFDAWWWQEAVVSGMSVGAPPDAFNADGQDWGVAVFDPEWLRSAQDDPLTRAWRLAARHATGLRIDHVMGLSRQFWIKHGSAPVDGEYAAYPFDELLARLVAVSRETGTWVVGEDLGTVQPGLRPRLAAAGVLSTKVIRFEQEPPAAWPELALGTASTHDLPPLAGGADDAHRALAGSPCLAVAATLEDTLGVSEPPNRPGVDDPRNWRQSLPLNVEQLVHDERMQKTADLMHVRSG
ncbi:MAG TPA: 4-alpha-glucanotransferase [Acidimicrobiales bacterium]|nr:4-alpha-glucanotransferase [Acidimicrobiales bacterium]